ncbi:hypothetical protein OKW96_13465 [Sphingobacterium sp. KU25419]|nr:hypothetical protein OKW96_13465 [Sphingobacterium sp. KU25419]
MHILRTDPKDYVLKQNNTQQLLAVVQDLYEQKLKVKITIKNNFFLTRGVYDLIAVLDESVDAKPYQIKGNLIDLFDPKLPIYTSRDVQVGEQCFFLNLDRIQDKQRPQVLAAASRTYDEKIDAHHYSFIAKSPIQTTIFHVYYYLESRKASSSISKKYLLN